MAEVIWHQKIHHEITHEELHRIALLKDQCWKHGYESQILWMNENIRYDDVHLWCEMQDDGEHTVIAYADLVNVRVSLDGVQMACVGIGNVCVLPDKQGYGYGKALMNCVRGYLDSQRALGILLCKKQLIGFYSQCGWSLLNTNKAIVNNNVYIHEIMVSDNPIANCSEYREIFLDRSF